MEMKLFGGYIGLKAKVATIAVAVAITGAAVFVPAGVLAAVDNATLIKQLQDQITALQAQLAALASPSAPASACSFTKDLTVGSRGDDVKCLQQALISKGHLASGLNTGYFGALTKAAVIKWQAASKVSPAAGYFGPKSRAAFGAAAPVVAAPSTPATPSTPTTPAVPAVPAGSGLTVTDPGQPGENLVPAGAAGVPFAKATFTASSDGDVTVNGVVVERRGLLDDAAFSGVIILDETGIRVGTSRTFNTDHKVSLTDPFVVKAGTSRTMTIAADMASSLTNQAGQVGSLAVISVTTTGTTKVNLASAIGGKNMTVNATLAIGSATMSRGVTDPGTATTKQVGTTGYIFSAVRLTAGSAEDLTVKKIRWYQAGSVASSDMANLKVTVSGKDYDPTVSSDGKYYVADFGAGLLVLKGNNLDISIKGDIVSGSGRTVDFDVQRKTDIIASGNSFGYLITPDCSSCTGSASAGNFSTNTEPFYNAFVVTVSTGTLRVDKSPQVPAANIPVNVVNTTFGGFLMEAKGEPIQVTALVLNFTFTGTGTSSNLTSVSLYDENGSVLAGPKDPSSGIVSYTSTFTVPSGVHYYTVKGKLSTTFANNDTITVALTPSNITAKGQVTGLSVTPTPSSQVSANTMTVRAAQLSVSVAPAPSAQTVVRGVSGFNFAQYQFDATASGEDIRITSVVLRDTYTNTPGVTDLNTCILWDGITQLNTGSNVINPTLDATSPDDFTFTLDNNLFIPKGTAKTINLNCNISAGAANTSTHGMGINSGVTNVVVAAGKDTNNNVTGSALTVTTSAGQVMTVSTGGVLTYTLDPSAPLVERYGLSGKTDQLNTVIKFHSANEAIQLDRLSLTLSSSTASTSDLVQVTLWDGAIKVGSAVFTGTNTLATSTLTVPFIIPKDGDKLLTIKTDMQPLGNNLPATRGHLVSVNIDGTGSTTTRGIGQSSGVFVNPAQGGNTAGVGVRMVKTVPTVTRLAVSSNTLTNGEIVLNRFSVAADPAGDVGLARVTFRVSSTTVATTSTFKLYAYSDSSFSTSAYANNPVHSRNVSNLNQDVWGGAGLLSKANIANNTIAFYFNPAVYSNAATAATTSESLNIPAGQTRYFELRGTVSGATTGDSIQVALQGDASFAANTSVVSRQNADAVADQTGTNDEFVWSPNTTSTAATTSDDWLNGFQVPGLPATEQSPQTFSK